MGRKKKKSKLHYRKAYTAARKHQKWCYHTHQRENQCSGLLEWKENSHQNMIRHRILSELQFDPTLKMQMPEESEGKTANQAHVKQTKWSLLGKIRKGVLVSGAPSFDCLVEYWEDASQTDFYRAVDICLQKHNSPWCFSWCCTRLYI